MNNEPIANYKPQRNRCPIRSCRSLVHGCVPLCRHFDGPLSFVVSRIQLLEQHLLVAIMFSIVFPGQSDSPRVKALST